MKPWSRRRNALLGFALIAATNAVVLAGVAWNRSGEPDGVIRLSQRELAVPYAWGMRSENSGISLQLRWRVAGRPGLGFNRAAEWLDNNKLRELGFDVSVPARARRDVIRLPREVLLVLEFNGDAYRGALAQAEANLKDAQSRSDAAPADRSAKAAAAGAVRQLAQERDGESRLFVIDAGRELSALRARYPDRARFVIVRGRVQVYATPSRSGPSLTGYVMDLSVPEINVPARYRGLFDAPRRRYPASAATRRPGYEVELAFGKRLEPWLIEAHAGAQ
ncbi:MAG: DUF4824 family protein [Burkholderiales bacterium]